MLDLHPHISILCAGSKATFDCKQSSVYMEASSSFKIMPPSVLIGRSNIVHSTVVIRKSVLDELGGYNVKRETLFDLDLWIRAMIHKHIFAIMPSCYVFKRVHSEQYFEKRKRIKYLLDTMILRFRAAYYFHDSVIDYLIPLVGFFYGLIPSNIRMIRHNKKNN